MTKVKRLTSDQLKEGLAKMCEEMKVSTGYAKNNEGWNNACDEIASRIRFTKSKREPLCKVRVWDNGDKTDCGIGLPCTIHGTQEPGATK
jgi:hypothetical protein